MNITVVGGGNVGTLMAAELAKKGHKVTVYTSKPECWRMHIVVFDTKDNLLLEGNIQCVKTYLSERPRIMPKGTIETNNRQ